jgi:hypothetical protein
MPSIRIMVLAAVLALSLPAVAAAEPALVADPEQFCEEAVKRIQRSASDAANLIAVTVGRPQSSGDLKNFLQILEGKDFDFTRKIIDKNYNDALRQVVFYSYIKNLGFAYFRFNFKRTSAGWILANFSFKDETNELLPKDFVEP